MNPGQYHQQPQDHGPPMPFQYSSENPDSLQASQQMFSFDGLPRTPSDQNFMTAHSSAAANLLPNEYNLNNQISMSQATLPWGDPNQYHYSFDDLNSHSNYGYSSGITTSTSDSSFPRGINCEETPRCMPDDVGEHSHHNMLLNDGYGCSLIYTVNAPCKPGMQSLLSSRSSLAFNSIDNPRELSRLSISTSPRGGTRRELTSSNIFDKPSPFRLPSKAPSEDGGHSSREMTAVEGEDPSADEPYAKLIYRALMSKPSHSMVLQEIYQWFRDNTLKGSSDTKGWMNSIRHNLSMNAVRAISSETTIFSTLLTFHRLSRKPSGKLLATKPKSQPNGFWKTLPLKMVFNRPPGIERERTRRSSRRRNLQ